MNGRGSGEFAPNVLPFLNYINNTATSDSSPRSGAKKPATMGPSSWGKPNIYENVYADTTRPFNGIRHILLLFKGSVLKLIWHDVAIFTAAYYALSLTYRLLLFHDPVAREAFEMVCIFAHTFSDLIPISFLTGFYVTQVVWRWWDQFMSLPWPDRVAFRLVSYCPGKVYLVYIIND